MENNPPATIPLWHFDENKGIWVESGVATLHETLNVPETAFTKTMNISWLP